MRIGLSHRFGIYSEYIALFTRRYMLLNNPSHSRSWDKSSSDTEQGRMKVFGSHKGGTSAKQLFIS